MSGMDIDPDVWRKSSYCERNACVLVACDPDRIRIHDMRDVLEFTHGSWRVFVASLKSGVGGVGGVNR
jgi:Domain of unknown function (DUF397)